MKEDFLHYLWKFTKFDMVNLNTTSGERLTIISPGQYLQLAGPDFFNAQIVIGTQKWAGNIEIHIRSSDWYAHFHEQDPAYENVVLHVVWEHDVEIFRKENSIIPVLELKSVTDSGSVEQYEYLMTNKSWIFCEKQLTQIDGFIIGHWQEKLFIERLQRKSVLISELLATSGNDWEAAFFCILARNFGLNTNGNAFFEIASQLPFDIVRKESENLVNLEALFLGTGGLLEGNHEDVYFTALKETYHFLKIKYDLPGCIDSELEFFKHRPDNFPSIRLAQLAYLYHSRQHLFATAIDLNNLKDFYRLFDVAVSPYWETHYLFDRVSSKKRKGLSHAFIDLLLLNSVIPMKFAFAKSRGDDNVEHIFQLAMSLPAESNAIIDKFSSFGIVSHNAFESQAMLQLKNEYCNKRRCLECGIGNELLKPKEKQKSL